MNLCSASLQACALRVTRLLPSGVPKPGTNNMVVTDSLTEMVVTPVYTAGADLEKLTASGKVKFIFKDDDRFKRIDFDLTICSVDPSVTELLAGGAVLESGAREGYAFPQVGSGNNCGVGGRDGVSIEIWTRNLLEGGYSDPIEPYLHWVFPRCFGHLAPRTFNDDIQDVKFTGFGLENPNWYDGPVGDWPLPSQSARCGQFIEAETLPTTVCGYQTVVAS